MFSSQAKKNEETRGLVAQPGSSNNDSSLFSDLFQDLDPPLIHLCVPSCSGECCYCGECCSFLSVGNVAVGHAFDMILVQSDQNTTSVACTDAIFSFNAISGIPNCAVNLKRSNIDLEVDGKNNLRFPIRDGKILAPRPGPYKDPENMRMDREEEDQALPTSTYQSSFTGDHDVKALQKLAESCVRGGVTNIRIVVRDRSSDRVVAVAPCSLYSWSTSDRIFVCDVDGTITRSNTGGIWDNLVAKTYRHIHAGVCPFLQSVVRRQQDGVPPIRILYLSSRPLELSFVTRNLLRKARQQPSTTKQHGGQSMMVGVPQGPLLGFAGSLAQVLYMELLMHNVYEFKTETLRHVARLWKRASGNDNLQPFYLGMGNNFMDAKAYHQSGMGLEQIYIIDKQSQIHCLDRPPKSPSDYFSPVDKDDYRAAQHTLFPMGYLDKNIVGHISSTKRKSESASVV